MKHIHIIKPNAKIGPWAATVPVKPFTMMTANGYNVALTKRNYFVDTKADNKLRYETMRAEGSSAEYYMDLYIEVYPGMFLYRAIVTDSNVSDIIEMNTKRLDNFSTKTVDNLRKALTWVN